MYFLNQETNCTKQNYILYVGRLCPSKNIQGIIKALVLVNKQL